MKVSSVVVSLTPLFSSHILSCPPVLSELKYVLQTEMERRERGVSPRVTFSPPSSNDHDYQRTGTLELLGQNAEKCIETQLKLKVELKTELNQSVF